MNNKTGSKYIKTERFNTYSVSGIIFETTANKKQFEACLNYVKTLTLSLSGTVDILVDTLNASGLKCELKNPVVDATFNF